MISDLEDDLTISSSLFEYYNQVLESVAEADRLLSAANPDARAVVVTAYRASEFNNHPTNSATWDQIVSSGNIGLLPSSTIESGLSEYYKYLDPLNTGNMRVLESPYRHAVRSLIPLPVQLAIREGCSDVLDEINSSTGFVFECVLDVTDSQFRRTADDLLSSKAVRESLRYQYSIVSFMTTNYEGNVVQIERLLAALEEGAIVFLRN